MISPVLRRLGPPRFRRWLAERWPNPQVKKALHVIDILEETSRQIYRDKRTALQNGDTKVTHQVREGKDIMSRLREYDCVLVGQESKYGTVKANVEAVEEERLSEDELVAQVS